MIIETVTAQAVSLRIPREELGARGTITPREARAAVARALESSGKRPWKRMEISLFSGGTGAAADRPAAGGAALQLPF